MRPHEGRCPSANDGEFSAPPANDLCDRAEARILEQHSSFEPVCPDADTRGVERGRPVR
jgi:hypothetical protein